MPLLILKEMSGAHKKNLVQKPGACIFLPVNHKLLFSLMKQHRPAGFLIRSSLRRDGTVNLGGQLNDKALLKKNANVRNVVYYKTSGK